MSKALNHWFNGVHKTGVCAPESLTLFSVAINHFILIVNIDTLLPPSFFSLNMLVECFVVRMNRV